MEDERTNGHPTYIAILSRRDNLTVEISSMTDKQYDR